MQLGRPKPIRCPHCSALASFYTVLSYNNFEAVTWSNGNSTGSMDFLHPPITRCRNCKRVYWLAKAKRSRATLPEGPIHYQLVREAIFEKAPLIAQPDLEDYLEALRLGLATNTKEEKILRTRVYWEAGQSVENTCRLFELLDPLKLEEALLKAEIARRRGDFKEARSILKGHRGKRGSQVAQMRGWISKRSRRLRKYVRQQPDL